MSDEEVKKSLDDARDDSGESDIVEFEYNEDLPAQAGGLEDAIKKIKKLQSDLKQARKEKEEYLTGWQKERADFANYKKDEDTRKALFSEAMRERILNRFLSVMDSFNMAMGNSEAWEKVDKNWRLGVEHIYSDLSKIFEEHGVKAIGEVGESFDPALHHSLEVVPTDKKEDNHKVAKVVQKGYKLGERVMRPAGVHVYEYTEHKE